MYDSDEILNTDQGSAAFVAVAEVEAVVAEAEAGAINAAAASTATPAIARVTVRMSWMSPREQTGREKEPP
ncbi:hypothetical protein HerbRD11066_24180 [Herbidospora sp. RD11066]